jgi:glycine cleavage system H protein
MSRPDNCRYATSHEWARLESDGTVTIGITDFAVQQLNDLTYLELPEVGGTASKGDSFGEIESVKAVSDLYAPVSGEIVAVNGDADGDDFAKMKSDAFGAGWLIKVKPSDPSELDSLLDLAAYEKQLAEG